MTEEVLATRHSRTMRPLRALAGQAARITLPLWWRATRTRVVLTSVPKCGTHLVAHMFNLIDLPVRREIYANDDSTMRALDESLAASQGAAVICHLHGLRSYRDLAEAWGAKVIFIYRDPRDQVVSHMFHYRLHPDHELHPYYRDCVPNLDDALLATIRGFGPGSHGRLDDVGTYFRYFLGWKDLPGVFVTTFERLVGAQGGGSADAQRADVRGILCHIGFPLCSGLAARLVANRVFSELSPTFRAGRIGSWRKYFKPQHTDAFKEVAGQLLIDLGYESTNDW